MRGSKLIGFIIAALLVGACGKTGQKIVDPPGQAAGGTPSNAKPSTVIAPAASAAPAAAAPSTTSTTQTSVRDPRFDSFFAFCDTTPHPDQNFCSTQCAKKDDGTEPLADCGACVVTDMCSLRGLQVDSQGTPVDIALGPQGYPGYAAYANPAYQATLAGYYLRFPGGVVPYRSQMFQQLAPQLAPYCVTSSCAQQVNVQTFVQTRYLLSCMDDMAYNVECGNQHKAQEIFYSIQPQVQNYGTPAIRSGWDEFKLGLSGMGKSAVAGVAGAGMGILQGVLGGAVGFAGAVAHDVGRSVNGYIGGAMAASYRAAPNLALTMNQYGYLPAAVQAQPVCTGQIQVVQTLTQCTCLSACVVGIQ